MNIGKREIAILTGLAADVAANAKLTPSPTCRDYRQRVQREQAEEGMAHIDPARWLGIEITPSQSVMNSRSYRKLEKLGLVERVFTGYGTKTTLLAITPKGLAAVADLNK